MLSNIGRLAMDLVYGPRCIACGCLRGHCEDDLCETCLETLLAPRAARCARCGCRLGPHESAGRDCPRCRAIAYRFRSVLASYSYEGAIRHLVLSAKRRGAVFVAERLAGCFLERIDRNDGLKDLDVVVPVPMHWWSERLRGVNLAGVLARRLVQAKALRLRPEALSQVKPNSTQQALSRAERARNVMGLYAPGKGIRLEGHSVLLVDDVLTTGATASECARLLRGMGARRVHVAVLARTEPHRDRHQTDTPEESGE